MSLEEIEPIVGYGDFSHVDPLDVNHYEVNELIVRCARDQGVSVELVPEGDGIDFRSVPADQNRLASEVVAACRRGLSLPEGEGAYFGYSYEQAQRLYNHYLWVAECLAGEGLTQPDPPSFSTWLESGEWHPYFGVRAGINPRISRKCPQWPGMPPES